MPQPNNYVRRLNKLLAGTPMANQGRLIARIENKNRLPRGLLAGIARAESSFGTAGRSGHQTNPFGWMRAGGPSAGLMPFNNISKAIIHVGNTLGQRGWRDPAKFEQTYVGYTNSPWLSNVQSVMRQFGGGVAPNPGRVTPRRTGRRNGDTSVSIQDSDQTRKLMLLTVLMAARGGNSMAAMLPLLSALRAPKTPGRPAGNINGTPVELGRGVNRRDREVGEILTLAKKFIGTQYIFGSAAGRSDFGKTPAAFDCSGFVSWLIYRATGKKLPAYTGSQVNLGQRIPSVGKAKPGDQLFFDTYQQYGHSGLYLGNGKFIHASSSGGVKISNLSSYPYRPSAIRRHAL
jgi:cell wall-associated NlpC family hydrolase